MSQRSLPNQYVLPCLVCCHSCTQTNLTWLDLSFNKITKIEGLETLTKLTDLSLFSNQISEIENLDTLVNLNALSLGEWS